MADRSVTRVEVVETTPTRANVKHFNQVEVARRWGLSPRTLERWRSEGSGPTYLRLGGHVAYRLEDIEAFEAAGRRVTASGVPGGGR